MIQKNDPINKFRPVMLVIIILLCGGNVFSQPDKKRAEANRALAEGKILADQETVESSEQALAKFRIAARLFEETGDQNGAGEAALETGLVLQQLGKRDEALKSYDQAYKLFEATSNRLLQARTVNFIGVIYSSLGEKKKALELYNVALRVLYELDEFEEAIPVMNNVGSIYREFGDMENALFYFNLALPFVRQTGDKGSEAMILLNIGDVYEFSKEPAKALDFYLQSLPLHKAAGNDNGLARALNKAGVAGFKLGKNAEAVDYFNRSLAVNGSRFKLDEALSLYYLMVAWKTSGNRALAVFYGKQAVNKYQTLRQGIRQLDGQIRNTYLRTIEDTYRQLADLLIESGLFARAEQVLAMLKEEEYFDFVRRDADEIKNLGKRVELTEKERKLLERYALLAGKYTEIGQRFQKLDDKRRRLSRTDETLSPEESRIYDELSAQLSDANAAFRLFLEKELVAEIGRPRAENIEFDRNLQGKLRSWGNGTVALYTLVTENRYRVILTTPTVQVDGKTEIPAAELNKKIFAFRAALQDIETDPRPLAKELYDILLKPVEKDLQASGAQTLVWSLDGTLRYIPPAALSPDGRTYLVEKYQNAVITQKTRDDVSGQNSVWTALGVGVSEGWSVLNPDKPDKKISFSPLPGTREELMSIVREPQIPDEKGILPGLRLLDKDFNRRNFADSLAAETAAGQRRFTVVHIASHFRLGSDWTNSFLLLGDGNILTLEQISNSPEITFGDVELVTLSACNTAFADESNGKEIDSLAEAIQTKSGRSVLATLWTVADESTPLLMSRFYRARTENPGLTKAAAMQTVQREMISGKIKPDAAYTETLAGLFESTESAPKKGLFQFDRNKPFAHPYFWSPFVLIGNWR